MTKFSMLAIPAVLCLVPLVAALTAWRLERRLMPEGRIYYTHAQHDPRLVREGTATNLAHR